MNCKLIFGTLLSYLYNYLISIVPFHFIRKIYLKLYLLSLGSQSHIQMGCKFLNGRKVIIGERNVINFGCLFDGRKYIIQTGSDVSIGPKATILTLGHDPQSAEFSDEGGDVVIGDHVWIGYGAIILPLIKIGEGCCGGGICRYKKRGPLRDSCRKSCEENW